MLYKTIQMPDISSITAAVAAADDDADTVAMVMMT